MLRNDDSIVDCHDSAFAESRNDGNGMPFMFLFYRLPRLDFVKSRNDGVMAILLFFLDCHEATPLAMTKNGDSTQDSIESRNDGSRHRLPRLDFVKSRNDEQGDDSTHKNHRKDKQNATLD